MLVHHVVVLQDMPPDVEVVAFDALLGALDRTADHAILEWNVLGNVEPDHHRLQPVAAKQAHEIIFHGYE